MRTYNIKYIKRFALMRGMKCLSVEYHRCDEKLRFKCSQGHEYETSWTVFKQGCSCPYCIEVKKKTIEEVKEYARHFGYECLSNKYKNNKTELKFQCDRGHIYETNWHRFQQGQRCPACYGNKKKTLKEVREYVEQFGYKCLSKEYKDNKTKLKFQCPENHVFEKGFEVFSRGHRCPICYRQNNYGENASHWKNYTKEELNEQQNYRVCIRQLTNQNFRKYYYLINPSKRKRGKHSNYHLDHIFSVMDGFKNNILPEIIASPINLRMLTALENTRKNGRSDFSKEILYELHDQFKKEMSIING